MNFLKRLLGYDDKFFKLLEASAVEAQASVQLLVKMLRDRAKTPVMEDFVYSRRKDKRITEEITEELCKTFVTPLEREDIEALSTALYKIPKTVEKFSERFMLCSDKVKDIDFTRQVELLEQATAVLTEMVIMLSRKAHLEQVKGQNDRLHYLEGEADKLMLGLIRELYEGKRDTLKVIILVDLYETLERIVDRCRDAGNVIFQIVLKYS